MKERNVLFHGSVPSDIWLRTIQITSKEPTAATLWTVFTVSSKGSFMNTHNQDSTCQLCRTGLNVK